MHWLDMGGGRLRFHPMQMGEVAHGRSRAPQKTAVTIAMARMPTRASTEHVIVPKTEIGWFSAPTLDPVR